MQTQQPAVIVFTGLPGTGKSSLAERVAQNLGAPAFAGDWLMGSLAPHGVLNHLDRAAYRSLYYDLLTTLITRQLMLRQSAVMDCLVDDQTVTRWREQADQFDARLIVLQCQCNDLDVHRKRIDGRQRGIPGWHEIDWQHVERMRVEFPPLTAEHVTLDTMGSIEDNLAQAMRHITNGGTARNDDAHH